MHTDSYCDVVTGNSIPVEVLADASFDWTTIRYNVLVLRPVKVTEWAVTSAVFSTKGVEVEVVFTGVVVEKKTLLVDGSLVLQLNLSVDVPTIVMRFVMTGAVTSAVAVVVKETGEERVMLPAASRDPMTAKYVVLAVRFVSVMR
jgi:hypothetical protein